MLLSTSTAGGGGKSVLAVMVKFSVKVRVAVVKVPEFRVAFMSQNIPATVPGMENPLAYGTAKELVTIPLAVGNETATLNVLLKTTWFISVTHCRF